MSKKSNLKHCSPVLVLRKELVPFQMDFICENNKEKVDLVANVAAALKISMDAK